MTWEIRDCSGFSEDPRDVEIRRLKERVAELERKVAPEPPSKKTVGEDIFEKFCYVEFTCHFSGGTLREWRGKGDPKDMIAAIDKAVADEREACAKVAYNHRGPGPLPKSPGKS